MVRLGAHTITRVKPAAVEIQLVDVVEVTFPWKEWGRARDKPSWKKTPLRLVIWCTISKHSQKDYSSLLYF